MIRDHGPSMMRLVAAYESNRANRDDLIQEIALALWKALPRFRGECSERTLLLRIAHDRALTHVWRRRQSPAELDRPGEVPDRRATPESHASAVEMRDRLLAAVRELPIGHRQVIVLLLEGMSHAEIAAVLGISEGNVAVRANRARSELRDRLEELR
ncbi:MAG: sigma-70 family RNA polymerase sigma factor [Bryobacteraceae bacterium]